MRRNRAIRNEIEDVLGSDTITEIERYNDRRVDSLANFGVNLTPEEECAQDLAWQALVKGEAA